MEEILEFYGFQFELCGFVFGYDQGRGTIDNWASGSGSDAPQPSPQRHREMLPDLCLQCQSKTRNPGAAGNSEGFVVFGNAVSYGPGLSVKASLHNLVCQRSRPPTPWR